MEWLTSYSSDAAVSDGFKGREDHRLLLAAGLFGEAGSVLAEIKKKEREAEAYPAYRQRLTEELGDFLWYFVRLASLCDPPLLDTLSAEPAGGPTLRPDLDLSLDLGAAVGEVLRQLRAASPLELYASLRLVWDNLTAIASSAGIDLQEAAILNLKKTQSRWPAKRCFHELFDEDCPVEEQIPRRLTIEFLERKTRNRIEVLLRYNGVNIGARLTDNISDPDGYRYHDAFHIAHAVFLGWSPVVRALLRCKRKSKLAIDENEDGARAIIIEEAVSAIVFSRAKNMRFFERAKQVDYDLLKGIQEYVRGYEVERVPIWQWETAIIEGYKVFGLLCSNRGGRVSWDLLERTLTWAPQIEARGGEAN